MTEHAGVICRRCGFANVAGDQFCGSCGAFLEWEGENAADAAAPAPADLGADDGLGGLVRPAAGAAAVVPPVAGPTPLPQPVVQAVPEAAFPVAPAAPGAPAAGAAVAGLLRCPGCGIANASTRTFCQSCGTRLAEATRVSEASREQIAAAVSARPVPVTATTASARGARTEPSRGSSRGIGGWVIGMAVVGIVVGVGIVAASVLLKGPGPASDASAAPSGLASAGPGSSAAAVSTAPDASGVPATAGPATPAPTQKIAGVPLKLTGAAASSVVGNLAKFQPGMAIDGNVKTSWQEGATSEKGQWIEVSFDPARVDAVVINNGYGASTALYKGNLRPKAVQISVDGGKPTEVTLKDTPNAQTFKLAEHPGATRLRITIVSTYGSVKTSVAGTPFDDAALSEVSVIGLAGG